MGTALVPAETPAGLAPGERIARCPQLARQFRTSCKIFGPERTLCRTKGKTLQISYREERLSRNLCKVTFPQAKSKAIPVCDGDFTENKPTAESSPWPAAHDLHGLRKDSA
jgi:hypothetical protein